MISRPNKNPSIEPDEYEFVLSYKPGFPDSAVYIKVFLSKAALDRAKLGFIFEHAISELLKKAKEKINE